MTALPFEKAKLQKLKLERNSGEPWGFALQTFGLRLAGDRSNSLHFLTFVDYVEMFSRAYDGGLCAGDIIVGIGIDDSTEILATQMQYATIQECPSELSPSAPLQTAVSERESSITGPHDHTAAIIGTLNSSETGYDVLTSTLNTAFANHDWVAAELRKAQRQLCLRIVREDCITKLQLFQRRIKLRTVLTIKKYELGQLEKQLTAKSKFFLRERGRKVRSGSGNSDVLSSKFESARDQIISSNCEAPGSSATSRQQFDYHVTSCSAYDRVSRLRAVVIDSIAVVDSCSYFSALAQQTEDAECLRQFSFNSEESPAQPSTTTSSLRSSVGAKDKESLPRRSGIEAIHNDAVSFRDATTAPV